MLGGANEDEYFEAINLVLADPNVDMVLPVLVPQSLVKPEKVAEAIVKSAQTSNKPVIVCMMGSASINEAQNLLHQNHIPSVDFPELSGVMFAALYKRFQIKEKHFAELEKPSNKVNMEARKLLKVNSKTKNWGEHLTRPFLQTYDIPLVEGALCHSIEEGILKASFLGFPVVMKIASNQILHKSEAGVVKVGITDEESFSITYKHLMEKAKEFNPTAQIDGILIEKLAAKGEEVIIGMKRDPVFGGMLMFGMGGIFVELFKDVSFRILPLRIGDAECMIKETQAFHILNGWRGGTRYDIKAIAKVMSKLSQLAMDIPKIQEVEINPLMVYPENQGVIGVDCRMILGDD
jgi:acetyltransferase